MDVVQDNPFKWLQEILLEIEARELLLYQKLVCQLSKTVHRVDSHEVVFMRADPDKVLAEHLPYLTPDKSDSSHVQISDLNNGL